MIPTRWACECQDGPYAGHLESVEHGQTRHLVEDFERDRPAQWYRVEWAEGSGEPLLYWDPDG